LNLLAVLLLGLLVSCSPSESEKPASLDSLGRKSAALTVFDGIRLRWSGGGTNNNCPTCETTNPSRACSLDGTPWANGQKTFTDPIPANSDLVVVKVEAKVSGRCIDVPGSGSSATIGVYLNSLKLGQYSTAEDPCGTNQNSDRTCETGKSASLNDENGITGYVYGGANTLRLEVPATVQYCVSHVDIILTAKSRSIQVSPGSLPFEVQKVGTTSAVKTVTVSNTGELTLKVSALSADEPFTIIEPTAPFDLLTGTNKDVKVAFNPTAVGDYTGSLTISHNDRSKPNQIVSASLSGKGVAYANAVSPTSLSFPDQRVGTESDPKTVTLRNAGSAELKVTSITTSANFLVTPNAPFTLAAGSTKDFSVTFKPSLKANLTGTLTLTTDEPDRANATVALSGQGVEPNLLLTPSPLVFDAQRVGTPSAAETVSVKNTGTGSIVVTSVSATAPFSLTSSAGFTLDPGATQTLLVKFTPIIEGTVTGTLTLNTADLAMPKVTLALSGEGVKPLLSGLPPTLDFNERDVRSPTPAPLQTVTVRNNGSGPIKITQLGITSGQPFNVTSSPQVPVTLAPSESATLTLTVTFNPSEEAINAHQATLTLTTDDTNTTPTVSLTGKAVKPVISVSPVALPFGNQPVNGSRTEKVTVTNTGSGTLTVNTLALSSGDYFSVNPASGFSLAKGVSRDILVTFSPETQTLVNDTLTLTSNDLNRTSLAVPLSGTGVKPELGLSPSTLNFGPQATGTISTAQTVTVTNTGTGELDISNISVPASFTVTPFTGFKLGRNKSQVFSVTFGPNALGLVQGALTFKTNIPEIPLASVSLSGTGVSWIQMSPVASGGTLNFGKVRVGTPSSREITYTNTSAGPVQLFSKSPLSPPFSVAVKAPGPDVPRELASGASVTFVVTYSPTAVEKVSNVLFEVGSNADNNPHRLLLEGEGVVPRLALDPSDHDFQEVRLTTSAVKTVTLTNEGDSPLTFTQPTLSANSPFSYIGPSTLTLQPHASIDFQVAFKPKESIISNDTLSIPSNSANSPTLLTLVGKGTYSEVKVDRSSIFFGDVRVGKESEPFTVKISNPGTADLTVQNLSVTGPFIAEDPSLGPDAGTALPLDIPKTGGSTTFRVWYKPTDAVTQNGSVTIITDANVGGGTTLPDGGIEGLGSVKVALQGNGTKSGLVLSTPQIDFGNQRAKESSGSQTVILSNNGSAELEITGFIFSNSAFSVPSSWGVLPSEGTPLKIGAGQLKAVPIVFTPGTLGAFNGVLSILSNAATPPAPLILKGVGIDGQVSLAPDVISFPAVEVGSSEVKLVTLTNIGEAPLRVEGVNPLPATSPFQVSLSVPSGGLVLAKGGTLPFTVTFEPTRRDFVSDTFTIRTDSRINPNFSQSVSGKGVAPAVTLDPAVINFGKSNVAVTTSQLISVKNVGEKELSISNISVEDVAQSTTNAALDFKAEAAYPLKVPPNGSVSVRLNFTPRDTGQRRAQAIFHSNVMTGPVTAEVVGEGTAPVLEAPPVLDFGAVLVDTVSTTKLLRLTNKGTGPLKISAVKQGPQDSAYFRMAPLTLPLVLPPQAFTEVSLTMLPNDARVFSGVIVVESDDLKFPSKEVLLSGTGVRQRIEVSKTLLDFGQQLVTSTSSPRELIVTNASDTPITLSSVTADNAQFLPVSLPLPRKLLGKDSVTLEVKYTPSSAAEVNSKLKLSFIDPPLQVEVTLHGQGIPTVLSFKPAVMDFGVVRAGGGVREQNLTINNLSSELIVLGESKVIKNQGESFEVPLLSGRSIEPGSFISVPIRYQPKVETLSETRLTLDTRTPVLPTPVELVLQGRATLSLLTVDVESLDFGRVDVKDVVEPKVVTISNKSAQSQLVVVKLKDPQGAPFKVDAKALVDPIPAGGSATFTVAFAPQDASAAENEVQVWLDGDKTATSAEALIVVKGHGRSIEGRGGGCSSGTGAGTAGALALLALVGLVSRRRRRA
jgi:MYXO-CTERM domain-containing protein